MNGKIARFRMQHVLFGSGGSTTAYIPNVHPRMRRDTPAASCSLKAFARAVATSCAASRGGFGYGVGSGPGETGVKLIAIGARNPAESPPSRRMSVSKR